MIKWLPGGAHGFEHLAHITYKTLKFVQFTPVGAIPTLGQELTQEWDVWYKRGCPEPIYERVKRVTEGRTTTMLTFPGHHVGQ